MYAIKEFKTDKHHLEDQADFINESLWDKDKVLKLTFSNDLDDKTKKYNVQIILLKKENGKCTLKLKFHTTTIKLITLSLNYLNYSIANRIEYLISLLVNLIVHITNKR